MFLEWMLKFLDFWLFLMDASSSINKNKNLTMMDRIIAKSLGIFNFLNELAISWRGVVDEYMMIAVRHTIKRIRSKKHQFRPTSLTVNQEYLQIMFPGWMNGWNIIITPPNGSSISNLLKESIYVYVYLNHFAVYMKLTQYCKSTIF